MFLQSTRQMFNLKFIQAMQYHRFKQENISNLLKGIEGRTTEWSPAQQSQKIPDDLRTAVHAAFLAITQPTTASDKLQDFSTNDQQNNSLNEKEYQVVADHLLEIISPLLTPTSNNNVESFAKTKPKVEDSVTWDFSKIETCYSDRSAVLAIVYLRRFVTANLDFIAELLRANHPQINFYEFAMYEGNRYRENYFLNRLAQPIVHRHHESAGDVNKSALSMSRMLDSGCWIDRSDLLTSFSMSVYCPMRGLFQSQLVHAICGENGSGKTCASILGLGNESIVVYCTLPSASLNIVSIDGSRGCSKYSSATRSLMGIVNFFVTGCTPKMSFQRMMDDEIEDFSFGTCVWTALPLNHKIHIVVDDAGSNPELCRRICGRWQSTCRKWFADEKRFNCSINRLFLSFVGSGLENSLEPAPGSLPNPYRCLTANPSRFLLLMLQRFCFETSTRSVDGKTMETPTDMALLAEAALALLYEKDKEREVFTPCAHDSVERQFLQLVTTNSRCVAFAIDEFRQLVRGLDATDKIDAQLIRKHLPEVCGNVTQRLAKFNERS